MEIEAEPDNDWEFDEWTGDVETDQETLNVIIEEDMSLTAQFDKVEDPPDDDDSEDDLNDDIDDGPGDDGPQDDELTDDDSPVAGDDTDDEDEPTDDDLPGFGVSGALAALGGAAYILKQRFPETGRPGVDEVNLEFTPQRRLQR